jgi:outer membrane immunogenic protein
MEFLTKIVQPTLVPPNPGVLPPEGINWGLNMRRLLLSALAAAGIFGGCANIAAAADMPTKAPARVAAPYNWTGFYVGVHGGYGFGNANFNFLPLNISHSIRGGLGGAQIGYNYQIANWVLGVEGEYSFASLKGNSLCPNPAFMCFTNVKSVASLTGRVGYAFQPAMLIYAKGGPAWTRGNFGASNAANPEDTGNVTTTGWTAGAGLEYGFSRNWSAKIEYDYYDFGTKRRDSYSPTGILVDTADYKLFFSAVKFGVNYRF